MNSIYASRRRNNIIVKFLCLGAALFGVTWLALILFTLFYNGLAGINLAVFTQDTPPPGSTEGGLRNAIIGSIIMFRYLGVAIKFSTLTGILRIASFLQCRTARLWRVDTFRRQHRMLGACRP